MQFLLKKYNSINQNFGFYVFQEVLFEFLFVFSKIVKLVVKLRYPVSNKTIYNRERNSYEFTGFQLRNKSLVSKYLSSLRCSVTCIPTLFRTKGQKILLLNPFTNVD